MPRVFLGMSILCGVGVNKRQQNPGARLGNWYRTQNLMQKFPLFAGGGDVYFPGL